jgi:hypothetical protein
MLHRVYRMLAKSQLRGQRRGCRRDVGPAAVFGVVRPEKRGHGSGGGDGFEAPPSRSKGSQAEIQRLAERYRRLNMDIDAHVPVQRMPVVIAPARRAAAAVVVATASWAALLAEIRARAAARAVQPG